MARVRYLCDQTLRGLRRCGKKHLLRALQSLERLFWVRQVTDPVFGACYAKQLLTNIIGNPFAQFFQIGVGLFSLNCGDFLVAAQLPVVPLDKRHADVDEPALLPKPVVTPVVNGPACKLLARKQANPNTGPARIRYLLN